MSVGVFKNHHFDYTETQIYNSLRRSASGCCGKDEGVFDAAESIPPLRGRQQPTLEPPEKVPSFPHVFSLNVFNSIMVY